MSTTNIDKIDSQLKYESDGSKLMIFDQNESPTNLDLDLSNAFVHFFYCKSGQPIFQFSPQYQRPLPEGSYFTIYDQNRSMPVSIHAQGTRLVYICIPPAEIHNVLLENRTAMVKLGFEGFGVRDYSVKDINFNLDLALDSLLQANEPNLLKSLFYKSKILELLSHTFDTTEEHLYEACPFLKEKDNVERIKKARNILIENLADPPSLSELAKQIGMNEYNLKIGFKNVYGLPAFKYLQEHRLNYSKKLLGEGQHQVSEIADIIGYKSSSHFIEAFRKKFGNTPKKFMGDVRK
jgi:AraC-like DNA-binding protein